MNAITKFLINSKTLTILFILMFVGIVYSSFRTRISSLNSNVQTNQETGVMSPTVKPKSLKIAGLDLNGPSACRFASSSAYIFQQQIYLENKTASQEGYLLYKSGCLYQWQKNTSQGKQTCGLEKYISLLGGIQSFGLNPQSLLENDMIKPILKQYNLPSNLSQGLSACKKVSASSLPAFAIPKSVQFSGK